MSPVYSSPRSGTAAAATTPARLAKQFDGQVLWRTAPDGITYVVALHDGVLERYRVEDDGSATLLDSSRRSLRWAYAGLAAGALLFVGGGIAADALDRPGMAVLAVAGWLLFGAAGVRIGLSHDLAGRAQRKYGGKGEWHWPTDISEWTPRSTEQLAAVERIADEHEGWAFVSDVGGRTVDVVAVRRGRTERYWVDEAGLAQLEETERADASYVFNRILMGSALLILLALLAVGFGVDEHKGKLIAVLVGALVAVMLLGWRNDPEARLARRLRGAGGRHWVQIRTKESDGGE